MEELEALAGKTYLPGDVIIPIEKLDLIADGNVKFGPGIRPDGKEIVAFKAGIFRIKEKPFSVWIDTNQKRYVAGKNDTVIGIIAARGGESYKVDIGCSQPANLINIDFEGATKRHKPNLKINDIVFAKLTVANKDMEPEITCKDENVKHSPLGELKEGYLFTVSLGLCRQLLKMPECKILSLLGKHLKFEIVVGMNGRVWINSKGIIDTIAIANAIVSSEFMDDEQIAFMVKQLVDSIAGFDEDDE